MLHGPRQGSVWKSLIPLIGTKEDDFAHSKIINYVSVQYMIEAAKAGGTCNRIVRITRKGEDPYGTQICPETHELLEIDIFYVHT